MLRTRLWMGTILASVAGAVLFGDAYLAPWFPILMIVIGAVAFPAVKEFLALQPADDRAGRISTTALVLLVLLANWYHLLPELAPDHFPATRDSWTPILLSATFAALLAFIIEMIKYRVPGHSVPRVANTLLAVIYLGVFTSFLIKLRWLNLPLGGVMLGLAIFVPKVGDIGAYTVGRIFGRTPFSPWLSPKKTWEGFFGGLISAVVATVGLDTVHAALYPEHPILFRHGWIEAILFGLVIGFAGILGDLAESLLKRDSQAKDASRAVPGFGGVLDVIDSVLFAAPVAYLWFAR